MRATLLGPRCWAWRAPRPEVFLFLLALCLITLAAIFLLAGIFLFVVDALDHPAQPLADSRPGELATRDRSGDAQLDVVKNLFWCLWG
ncbi:hypothetical protein DTL21_10455 [Bremerella cremea]|uniref:Uncharacterized protein n=1 Tax=Blastopirellula marina TaxID=124 RepID=A0A2S8FVV4_9BACT|nr:MULTISPECIES: hypothetical protein [Pirellulaceae]PQO36321.1 hypothetical protein C5Y83_10450 [Blastopirellula marina]RCS48998.1 hypothetical protein DTL21_10455 [Bremerella cremea]